MKTPVVESALTIPSPRDPPAARRATAASPPAAEPHPPAEPAGDFESGVLEFAGRLRAFIRKRVSNPEDAEDLAQEVLLRVFRARSRLRDPKRLEAWLYRTARRAIIDFYRRRRPTAELPPTLVDEGNSFDEVGERLRRSVRRFLQTLPDFYQRPLLLAEFEGRSVAEIARGLGLTVSATKSRLARGRALLRQKLEACCRFETDRFGRIIDFRQKQPACACEDPVPAALRPSARSPRASAKAGVAVRIELAVDGDEPAIIALLAASGLPASDLTPDHFLNFVTAKIGRQLIGCAAIEPLGHVGLLRSVAVVPGWRGSGVGRGLVGAIEILARQFGHEELFLLTTTAEAFFSRLGYDRTARDGVPEAISQSREFQTLCPASAVIMRKRVAAR